MGLTIHYSLQLNGSVDAARHAVNQLHGRATELRFESVSPILDLRGDDCDFERCEDNDPNRWMLIQARQLLTPGWVEVRPKHVIGFSAWPGEGCEPANIGLCRYPSTVIDQNGQKRPTKLQGWNWTSFCKTQFASNPSLGDVANFVRCHLAVIDLIDAAKSLGILSEVTDEGGFYDGRDVEALVREVSRWNESMAGLVGYLKDHVGNDLGAAITAYPNFEHLEAKARKDET